MSCGGQGRDQGRASPGRAKCQKLERDWTCSPSARRRNQLSWHLHLGLLASRILRRQTLRVKALGLGGFVEAALARAYVGLGEAAFCSGRG